MAKKIRFDFEWSFHSINDNNCGSFYQKMCTSVLRQLKQNEFKEYAFQFSMRLSISVWIDWLVERFECFNSIQRSERTLNNDQLQKITQIKIFPSSIRARIFCWHISLTTIIITSYAWQNAVSFFQILFLCMNDNKSSQVEIWKRGNKTKINKSNLELSLVKFKCFIQFKDDSPRINVRNV